MARDRNNPRMALFAKLVDRFCFIFDIFLTNGVEVVSDFPNEDLYIRKIQDESEAETHLIWGRRIMAHLCQ